MGLTEKDLNYLAEVIAKKVHEKSPPCQLLTEGDITILRDLVKKRRLMGKGFLWLLLAVMGMLGKDLYLLIKENFHWGL